MKYYNKVNYRQLVSYNYINYVDNYKFYNNKRRGDDNSRSFNSNKKSRKNKDNKDNKFKDKIYITSNNNFGNITINIVVTKLNILTYFVNLLFSSRL